MEELMEINKQNGEIPPTAVYIDNSSVLGGL